MSGEWIDAYNKWVKERYPEQKESESHSREYETVLALLGRRNDYIQDLEAELRELKCSKLANKTVTFEFRDEDLESIEDLKKQGYEFFQVMLMDRRGAERYVSVCLPASTPTSNAEQI